MKGVRGKEEWKRVKKGRKPGGRRWSTGRQTTNNESEGEEGREERERGKEMGDGSDLGM